MKKIALYIMLCISGTAAAQTITGVYNVGCTAYQQQYSQWCWAACTRMVDWTYSSTTPPSQCTIVNKANDQCDGWFNTCCSTLDGGRPSACTTPSSSNYPNNMGGCNGSLSWLINYYAGGNSYSGNSLSYSTVSSNLSNNRMMVARWGWSSGGGHFVVIYGCYQMNYVGQVQYANPGSGSKVTESYSYFLSNSSRTWTHSISMNGAAYHTRQAGEGQKLEMVNTRVFPNPSNGLIHLERFDDVSGEAKFSIMNALGEKIFSHVIPAYEMEATVDLSNQLSSGIYFIQIDNAGMQSTEKIIIQ
jgi:hypothetical protein